MGLVEFDRWVFEMDGWEDESLILLGGGEG
jgi:hypothetical protein